MNAVDILRELAGLGSAGYKKILMHNYGVKEPCFGVKIGDLKKIEKRIKVDYQLALDLYETGNYDAMYLAGLIADDKRMSCDDLQRWAERGSTGALPGATVPWVAAGSPHGWEMGLKWIDAKEPHVMVAGWTALGSVLALKDDAELDLKAIKRLLKRVEDTIAKSPDIVRYAMNGFVIAVGGYVKALSEEAISTGERIGPVHADLGNNQCSIPFAPDYIRKVAQRGSVGKKRKSVKC